MATIGVSIFREISIEVLHRSCNGTELQWSKPLQWSIENIHSSFKFLEPKKSATVNIHGTILTISLLYDCNRYILQIDLSCNTKKVLEKMLQPYGLKDFKLAKASPKHRVLKDGRLIAKSCGKIMVMSL